MSHLGGITTEIRQYNPQASISSRNSSGSSNSRNGSIVLTVEIKLLVVSSVVPVAEVVVTEVLVTAGVT